MVLSRFRLALAVLIPLDALTLCAAVSEGAHYASDVLAGGGVAMIAYVLAARIEASGKNVGFVKRRPPGHARSTCPVADATQKARGAGKTAAAGGGGRPML